MKDSCFSNGEVFSSSSRACSCRSIEWNNSPSFCLGQQDNSQQKRKLDSSRIPSFFKPPLIYSKFLILRFPFQRIRGRPHSGILHNMFEEQRMPDTFFLQTIFEGS
ncbi:hypothetical protein CEXT_578241 [Caerostris extrusa]|uniref:Ycf15 n=1 Tax=Caerostris extrusa TaxID=172846 RepID=A0AAV4Y0J2_CAEEX|nr:hypothetical protein CEXT_578241 [Caerostris extrusa]